jgi:hypothetical protein
MSMKTLAALSIAGLALAGVVAPAHAEVNNFGCPPFENAEWVVFQANIAPDVDRNGDNLICGKLVEGQPNSPLPGFVLIDNNV